MNEAEVGQTLAQVGAFLTGHFVYTSGRHGKDYINKDALYPHTDATSQLTYALAEQTANMDAEVVVGPALGGIILSQWVAYHLSKFAAREVLGVYAEKDPDGQMVLRRGYGELAQGKRVLIVEDIITTGQSISRTADAVRAADGMVIGMAALVNRSPREVSSDSLSVPLFALLNLELPSWSADECPLCAAGVPIQTRVGHRSQ